MGRSRKKICKSPTQKLLDNNDILMYSIFNKGRSVSGWEIYNNTEVKNLCNYTHCSTDKKSINAVYSVLSQNIEFSHQATNSKMMIE